MVNEREIIWKETGTNEIIRRDWSPAPSLIEHRDPFGTFEGTTYGGMD